MEEIASPPITLDIESWLRAATPLKPRAADRSYTLNLTGSMDQWSTNNVAWSPEVPPLSIVEGQRVELILVNRTKMAHPVHLHGHRFQVVAIGENRFSGAVRDTVLVPQKASVTIAFDVEVITAATKQDFFHGAGTRHAIADDHKPQCGHISNPRFMQSDQISIRPTSVTTYPVAPGGAPKSNSSFVSGERSSTTASGTCVPALAPIAK
jgi:hypothetical protein